MSVSYYKSPLKHDTAARCHSLAAESVQAVRRRKREDCYFLEKVLDKNKCLVHNEIKKEIAYGKGVYSS